MVSRSRMDCINEILRELDGTQDNDRLGLTEEDPFLSSASNSSMSLRIFASIAMPPSLDRASAGPINQKKRYRHCKAPCAVASGVVGLTLLHAFKAHLPQDLLELETTSKLESAPEDDAGTYVLTDFEEGSANLWDEASLEAIEAPVRQDSLVRQFHWVTGTKQCASNLIEDCEIDETVERHMQIHPSHPSVTASSDGVAFLPLFPSLGRGRKLTSVASSAGDTESLAMARPLQWVHSTKQCTSNLTEDCEINKTVEKHMQIASTSRTGTAANATLLPSSRGLAGGQTLASTPMVALPMVALRRREANGIGAH